MLGFISVLDGARQFSTDEQRRLQVAMVAEQAELAAESRLPSTSKLQETVPSERPAVAAAALAYGLSPVSRFAQL